MSSIIYNYGGTDKTLILDTRSILLQPFKALNWTDLRLSMMLSVTKQSDPLDPTSLTETIGAGEDNNQVYIGFKQSDSLYPPSTNFFGMSSQTFPTTTEATFLTNQPYNWQRASTLPVLYASNGTTKQGNNVVNPSAFQSSIQTLYATLVILQLLRNDPTVALVASLNYLSLPIGNSFYSDTSINNIRTQTRAATLTQGFGAFTFASIPDAIYAYWPFNLSRLRIHSYVLEKYA